MCYKPTTTVLATINTTDFLYTCLGHLTDSGFASAVVESTDATKKIGLSPEEIAKVKEEWEEQQKRKKEKAKAREKESKEGDEKDAKKETESKEAKTPGSWSSGSSTPAPTAPKHERYTLHRDYFAMRLSEHRKKRQAAQAKELAPRLPYAPSGAFLA